MQLRSESFLKPSLNWLPIFIPIALTLDRIAPDKPVLVFISAACAIIPVASHIVKSTSSSRFCFTFFPEIKV